MQTFKWAKGDDFGLGDLPPEIAADISSTLDRIVDADSPFYIGEGPWTTEPDKAFWVDDATGLDCMIHRSPGMGYLCGYVGVPEGHPLYGCDDWERINCVVGGAAARDINFTAGCDEGAAEAFGICHVPEPGRPKDVWWIGFDCGHFLDLKPGTAALMRGVSAMTGSEVPEPVFSAEIAEGEWFREVYRDFECVKGWVGELAEGLAACAVAMRRAGAGRRSRHA